MSSGPSDQWPAIDPLSQQPYQQGQAHEQARPFPGPSPQAGTAGHEQGDWHATPNPGPQPYGQPYQYGQPQPYAQVQPYGQPQAGSPVQQVVAAKNPAIGVVLSFFIPGLGTMVNGSAGRGVLILALYAVGWLLSFFLIGIPILIGAWIWGLVDGYTSAQRWNRKHGIVS
jgi:TM2 domain-containing membrane protein YozV